MSTQTYDSWSQKFPHVFYTSYVTFMNPRSEFVLCSTGETVVQNSPAAERRLQSDTNEEMLIRNHGVIFQVERPALVCPPFPLYIPLHV